MSTSARVSLVVGYDVTGVERWTKNAEKIQKCSCGRQPTDDESYCSKCGKAVTRTWEWKPTEKLSRLAQAMNVDPLHIHHPDDLGWSRAEVIFAWHHRGKVVGLILGKLIHETADMMYSDNQAAAPLDQQKIEVAFGEVVTWGAILGLTQEPQLWLVPSVG